MVSSPEIALGVLVLLVGIICGVLYVVAKLHGERTVEHKEYREMTPREREKFDRATKKMDEAFKKMNEAWEELR